MKPHDRRQENIENPRLPSLTHDPSRAPERGQRGYDAGKKSKGRKPHIAVDTMRFMRSVVVHSASIRDRIGESVVLIRLFRWIPNLQMVAIPAN
ncbi:MAG: transposase [Zoogloeaceae bacterium]|nr:transposase [Zoogloeaceae bacterium]